MYRQRQTINPTNQTPPLFKQPDTVFRLGTPPYPGNGTKWGMPQPTPTNTPIGVFKMNEPKFKPKVLLQGWQDAYIDFLANPTQTRTQTAFCQEHNISPSAVYVWRTKNYQMVYTQADKRRQLYKSQLRQKAYKALAARLQKSDKAIQLALTLCGDIDQKPQGTHVHLYDLQEKRQKAWEVLQRLKVKEVATEAAKATPEKQNP